MGRFYRVIVLGMLGLGLVSVQAGCLAVAAGVGAGAGVAYYKGTAEAIMEADTERVVTASKAAVEEMKFALVSSEASAVDGRVIARTANDARVDIVMKSRGENLTAVSVRIGRFGDQALSNQIMEKIRANL